MSGHNKWSTIKHKKAAADAKRGKVFTKIIKELTIAARLGGGDPEGNPRLRTAVAAAKAANMPADNLKRAIQKGTGELPGVTYEEIAYEAYGPGGVAVYIECLTDNKMRTTPEIRHILSKHGGNLAEPNSVAWIFDKRGNFMVSADAVDEDRLMEVVLEAGADDLSREDDLFEVETSPETFNAVNEALEAAGIAPSEAGIVMVPSNMVKLDGKKAEQCIKLLEIIEDHDDVQKVSANLDFDESEID
ncbi:MAG: YebC/PmpR family DNA-binding transcriptional regulator [Acidobacteria bacterium]|uniref:Probable transcriptional regulatory protein IFK94_13910 n=1 Tax=Candidatus Polarisedimenticola svalbardensis TaxID=2886004 RepID=A0A8J6XX22_9BACT|nr:YebC/PmpR family DNA-binding transcriptional regulator [Candidatus Polarisedimenticola svalbardensis]